MTDKRKRRKRVIALLIAVAVCIVAIVYVPFPTWVNVSFDGIQTTADGETKEAVTISVKGWWMHYLFFTDELKSDVTITGDFPGERKNTVVYQTMGDVYDPMMNFKFVSTMHYCAVENQYTSGDLFFKDGFDMVIATGHLNDDYYFAVRDESISADERQQFLDEVVRFWKKG